MQKLGTLWREPLVHFLLLAAALFAVEAVWSPNDRDTIVVDRATVDHLVKQQEDLVLRPLDAAERQQVIDTFIEAEILVREARKRGFDDASRIRTLLVQNMRIFLAKDLEKPTEADLKAWFETNLDRFRAPEAITYDHVFYRDPDAVPEGLLQRLRAGADPNTLGDRLPTGGSRLYKLTRRNVAGSFGPDAARQILAIADDDWHGPFRSPGGTHFLRIAERHPPREPAFEDVAAYLEGDWTLARQRERVSEAVAEMARDYEIVVEPAEDPQREARR